MNKFLIYLLVFLLFLTLGLTGFYLYKSKTINFSFESLSKPAFLLKKDSTRFEVLQVIDAYQSQDENSKIGTIHPGINFVCLEKKGQWWRIKTIPPENSLNWQGWIKPKDNDYKEIEKK